MDTGISNAELQQLAQLLGVTHLSSKKQDVMVEIVGGGLAEAFLRSLAPILTDKQKRGVADYFAREDVQGLIAYLHEHVPDLQDRFKEAFAISSGAR